MNNLIRNVDALTANVGADVGICFHGGMARRCPRGQGRLGVFSQFHNALGVPRGRGGRRHYMTYNLYRVTYPGSAVGIVDRAVRARSNGGGGVLTECRCSLNTYVFYRLYIGTYPRSTVAFSRGFRRTMFSEAGLMLGLGRSNDGMVRGGGRIWSVKSALRAMMFCFLTTFVVTVSVVAIAARHVIHSTACLLFILFNATNVCFLLNCAFLNSIRVVICTNNVIILCMFSVLLADKRNSHTRGLGQDEFFTKLFAVITNTTVVLFVALGRGFLRAGGLTPRRVGVRSVNRTLLDDSGCNCVLPFRTIDVLLLTYVVNNVVVTHGEWKRLGLGVEGWGCAVVVRVRCCLMISAVVVFTKVCKFFAHQGALTVLVSIRLVLGTASVGFTIFGHFLFPKKVRNCFFTLFSVTVSTTRATVTVTVVVGVCHGVQDVRIHGLSRLG